MNWNKGLSCSFSPVVVQKGVHMPNRTEQFEFFTNDKLVRDDMDEEESTENASKPNSEPQENSTGKRHFISGNF